MRPAAKRTGFAPGRGQSLAEFAIVFPIMFLIVAAIIQFGLIFWSQNTLTQVARDTGRWAATQQECDSPAAIQGVVDTANQLAASSTLFGYDGSWTDAANVDVTWTRDGSPPADCPPAGNQEVAYVTIRLTYQIPLFFPFLPVSDTLSTETEFRMEPVSG
jgi:hypothetical protein